MTKPSKYFPPFEPPKVTPVGNMNDLLQTVCTDAPTKPAGSSPALRIACPVCKARPGAYCTKTEKMPLLEAEKYGVDCGTRQVQQTIAHKKRREEEERTR